MNIAIDSNAHIKTVINVYPYIYDCECDSLNGKCNIKGKIGIKILYIDVDNVYNTLTDEQSFNETINSQDITHDLKTYLYNEQITPSIEYDEKYLRVNLNVNAKLYANIDLGINSPDTNLDNLIAKKNFLLNLLAWVDVFKKYVR